jgi:hypothetical protein
MNSDSSRFKLPSNKITTDTSYSDKKYGITEPISDIISDVYFDVTKGKKSVFKKLNRLCRKYPGVPHFKNYLCKAYDDAGDGKKAEEINAWLLEAHPDYLFGIVTQANMLIARGETEKVPELLGEEMAIQSLYPGRDEFHIDEVLSFYGTTVNYFLETGDRETAMMRLEAMQELDSEAPQTLAAVRAMMSYNMEIGRKQIEADNARKRTVKSREYRKATQTNQKPSFTHPEIEYLYCNGLDIHHNLIREILALPRESLIADLEAVIEDAINRHEALKEEVHEYGWDEDKYTFSIHAAFLLAELDSEDSLPVLLELIRQGEEFLDFWYYERLEEFFEEPVALLGRNRLQELSEFVKEPDNFTYARTTGASAAGKIALFFPELRDTVLSIYKEWFNYHLDQIDNERVLDTTLLSYMVWNCMDMKAGDLLGDIKTLYDKNLIHFSIVGSYEDVEAAMTEKDSFHGEQLRDIFTRYDQVANNLFYNSDGDDELESSGGPGFPFISPFMPGYENSPFPAMNPFMDAGRNDPCPCGSGRKYKKCCMI